MADDGAASACSCSAAVERLKAQVDALELQLAELRRQIAGGAGQARQQLHGRDRLFLSLAAAAAQLGLGRARVQQLVEAGALRVVRFPNGAVRVPRSELLRIDALGLEVALAPAPRVEADAPSEADQPRGPQEPDEARVPRAAAGA